MPPSARHSPLLALAWLPLLALLAAALQGSAAPGLALSVVSVLCVLAIGLSCYEQHVDVRTLSPPLYSTCTYAIALSPTSRQRERLLGS